MNKNILKTFIGLISLFICFSCSQKKKSQPIDIKSNYISINFKEVPFVSDTLRIDKNRFIIQRNPLLSYKLKGDYKVTLIENQKQFNIKIDKDTIYFKLRYGFNDFETYVFCKGDSATVRFQDSNPIIEIINRKSKKYDYDFTSIQKNRKKPLDIHAFIIKNKRIRNKKEKIEFKKQVNDYNNKVLVELDSLRKSNLISNFIYEFKRKNVLYSFSKNEEEIKAFIRKNNDLHIDSYTVLIMKYVNSKILPNVVSTSNGFVFNSKAGFDYVIGNNLFKGKVQEFLLQNYIKRVAKDFSLIDLENRYKILIEKVNNKTLHEDIKNEFLIDYAEINKKTQNVFLINLNKKQITLDQIIKKHKGKVVFVDFWASWCAPCIKAMPDSRKLMKEYKNKEIVFLFLSIDKNFNAWKKAQEKEGLSSYKDSKLVINYPNASFFQKLNVKEIPRYLIFNKKGELIHKNAPSPSSNEIRKTLNSFLLD